jgi:CheY-like chemotaxis protein
MPKKILVVDDEKDVIYILEDALKKEGYDIESASDGVEALEKVSRFMPDLIILDIMMPKLDGHSVNLKLKESTATAKIPVIFITAYGQLKELLDTREEFPVAGYIEKPFPVSTIIGKVKELLGDK